MSDVTPPLSSLSYSFTSSSSRGSLEVMRAVTFMESVVELFVIRSMRVYSRFSTVIV